MERRQLVVAEYNDNEYTTYTTCDMAKQPSAKQLHALKVQLSQLRQIVERDREGRQLVAAEHHDDTNAKHTTRNTETR